MNNFKQEVKEGRRTELYFGRKLELPAIMYGFGDVCQPRRDSVALLETYVIDFIVDLVEKCSEVAHERKRERPDINDLKFVIRKDKKKLNRVHYLLRMKRIIDRSRFAIDRHMLPIK
ncbi:hypothetical protein GpartN1_g1113.t1 [Galdieria partita]|uniref:Transcription initiation factor TFIID subunit 13 n=1 Tax=Galdieria partita TaxID=83374 RepID=A0A9C7UNG4_9RHOD|nr:hypothetical protein GpartN1_g1113.t1 [Galdieria partita]